jgi:hypothetical protein
MAGKSQQSLLLGQPRQPFELRHSIYVRTLALISSVVELAATGEARLLQSADVPGRLTSIRFSPLIELTTT